MKRPITATVIIAAYAAGAYAAESTGTLQVQASVLNTCVVSTSPVAFANVGLTEATANGSVTVNCTNSAGFTVELDGGAAGNINARTLSHVSEPTEFTYQLYTDAGYSNVWGDGVTGSINNGTGPSQTFVVYGRTTGTPDTAGNYADEVQVTVTY